MCFASSVVSSEGTVHPEIMLYYFPEVFRSEINSCVIRKRSEEQLVKCGVNGRGRTVKTKKLKKAEKVKNSKKRVKNSAE